jgi:hypothetical protein
VAYDQGEEMHSNPSGLLTSYKDDASAIHIPTLKRWNLIFRVFTAEYLRLKLSDRPSKRAINDELVIVASNSSHPRLLTGMLVAWNHAIALMRQPRRLGAHSYLSANMYTASLVPPNLETAFILPV